MKKVCFLPEFPCEIVCKGSRYRRQFVSHTCAYLHCVECCRRAFFFLCYRILNLSSDVFDILEPYEEENEQEISHELWQEACWIVINAYFDEKGLVRQQLDSFDEFIQVDILVYFNNCSLIIRQPN